MRDVRDGTFATQQMAVDAKILAAKSLVWQIAANPAPVELDAVEFQVSSQFGEDGIIQYLIRRAAIPRDCQCFVEFGTDNYSEANTRFLLINDNWRGLIMDGSESNMAAVRASSLYWKYDLTAKSAFIDRDNINGLISTAGFEGEIGLLSIDLDGNDYWVWERITAVDPIIVVVEYNGLFGADRAVTIPYERTFDRADAHYSHLYWGASLRALEILAHRKGYALVGSNSAGNNAFFVKRPHLNGQPELNSTRAYREPHYRESRDRHGNLTFLSGPARLEAIAEMPLLDVQQDEIVKVGDLRRDV